MQFVSGGNLRELMKKQKEFTEEELMNFLTMMLIGLQYLQVNDVMHRDLKPENILIDTLQNKFKILQISDFGLSKNINEEVHSETLAKLTTRQYIAPEILKDEPSNT